MAKNKVPHSSRPRKNPRYNRAAEAQRLRREKEKQRRSNENTDSDAIFLDQEPIERLKVNDCSDLDPETRGQSFSERWRQERALRISSSIFKEIACRRSSTPCSKLGKRIVYKNNVSILAMKYGFG
ncbi:hypothetical protein AVEN_158959-1 [Araneus ventricosus]|uniref:Uncharacterized protein n=1 Tax=Araneus ventricosus TaxID=182803 RepID=A0A4Y2B9Z1_ARAVE|nr:hypothetical protein AVEN_158959-1 [Araneus ventricosus]